jgi:hypothetical protein
MKDWMHRLMLRASCLLLPLLLSYGTSEGATYYVAMNGDDTYAGSSTSPWRNITHALSSVCDGDTIVLGAGQFNEWLSITNSITLTGSDIYHKANPPLSRHDSLTIIRPPSTNRTDSALVSVFATNVVIQNLSINGDADSNGVSDIKCGIYSTNRPINVNHCVISTVRGYGIYYAGATPTPPPLPDDTDSVRAYFANNFITNITHTDFESATGILMQHGPASCVSNEIVDVKGVSAMAGIFLESCFYTSNMTHGVTVSDNFLSDCTMAIWANKFGTKGEKMDISRNTITNAVIGIRLSGSKGQAMIENNRVAVTGNTPSTNALPARGIWLQTDYDPWNTNSLAATDHLVNDNYLSGTSSNADNTVGLLFEYDAIPSDSWNNGVRATVLSNYVYRFDYGALIESGTDGVTRPHDPLVEVVFHYNDIVGNTSYGIFTTGFTNSVNAISNWWGSTNGPVAPYANPVSSNVLFYPWIGFAQTTDTDGDWIPDYLDPDIDNDGSLNWEEIIAGTDPSNVLSVLKFSAAGWSPDGSFVVTWRSVSNRTYKLYQTTNLLTYSWTLLTNASATPPTNTYLDTNARMMKQAFYEVTVTN